MITFTKEFLTGKNHFLFSLGLVQNLEFLIIEYDLFTSYLLNLRANIRY